MKVCIGWKGIMKLAQYRRMVPYLKRAYHSFIQRLLLPIGAPRPFLPPRFALPLAKARAPFPPLACRIALRTLRTPSFPPALSLRDFFAVGPSRSNFAAIA